MYSRSPGKNKKIFIQLNSRVLNHVFKKMHNLVCQISTVKTFDHQTLMSSVCFLSHLRQNIVWYIGFLRGYRWGVG